MAADYTDFEVLANEAHAVAGAVGHTSRSSGTAELATPRKNVTTEVAWVRGAHGYLLDLIALEDHHAKHRADFEAVLAGFEFLNE